MTPVRIVHLSTLHAARDVRIFHKECRTLSAAGYEVHLVVRKPPDETQEGVRFHAIESPDEGRVRRMAARLRGAYRLARGLRADLYHFHDPELIPIGLLLKRHSARVIYDVHEDAPREALTLNKRRRIEGAVKFLVWEILEWIARRMLDGFVCATPSIARRFPPERTIVVRNVPRLDEFLSAEGGTEAALPLERERTAIYAGGITEVRGIREMVAAMARVPAELGVRLALLGTFLPSSLEETLSHQPGWDRVDVLGWQTRDEVVRYLQRARVGLLLFHPKPDHLEALPNKLFEYMAAGLPIVASAFPLWREIITLCRCGVLVDPLDANAIAEAVTRLIEHPEEAERMGKAGRIAVQERYNWEAEAGQLVDLYERLLHEDH